MFERKGHKQTPKRIDSLIGTGTTVAGDVSFSGGLRIDGVVKGNVIPTPFLIATWLAHFVLLVILFYSLQTGFNRRKARKHGATA